MVETGAYAAIGFVWFVWLYASDQIEGEWSEYLRHGLLWPLDMAERFLRRCG